MPGFSPLSLSCFLDPLRHANHHAGRELFDWQFFGLSSAPVTSASGMAVEVNGDLASCKLHEKSVLVLIGGNRIEDQVATQLAPILRQWGRHQLPICAIGTATWLLAAAGVLRNRMRCTTHFTLLAALEETFPDLAVEDALFVQDGNITTCAGEFAAFDLAADIVQRQGGHELANQVCGQVIGDRWRAGANSQSLPPGLRYSGTDEKVTRVVELMSRNIEDPLSLKRISDEVSLSTRQIERLFKKHLQVSPMQYYMSLRLEKARQLLEMTNMPVIEVAIACGYVSSSHFSKSFKDHFSMLPGRTRANIGLRASAA